MKLIENFHVDSHSFTKEKNWQLFLSRESFENFGGKPQTNKKTGRIDNNTRRSASNRTVK